jgi:hypothetical protein
MCGHVASGKRNVSRWATREQLLLAPTGYVQGYNQNGETARKFI